MVIMHCFLTRARLSDGPLLQTLHTKYQLACSCACRRTKTQSQSILFLREVVAFRDSMYAAEVDERAQFREFLYIANKFIRQSSSYEVNIDSRARKAVMRYIEEDKFKELDVVSECIRSFDEPSTTNRKTSRTLYAGVHRFAGNMANYCHGVAATFFTINVVHARRSEGGFVSSRSKVLFKGGGPHMVGS